MKRLDPRSRSRGQDFRTAGLIPVRYSILAIVACAACGSTPEPEGDPVADFEMLAYVDDNGNGLSHDDAPRTIHLKDYFAAQRPGTRIVMLNAAAGWCAPCMAEASALGEFAAAYEARGVVVLTAVIQDQNGAASTAEFARLWAETFALPVPTLVDVDFVTEPYFDLSTMPANLFIDAETERTLEVAVGAMAGDDPMREYRELLDYYLSR